MEINFILLVPCEMHNDVSIKKYVTILHAFQFFKKCVCVCMCRGLFMHSAIFFKLEYVLTIHFLERKFFAQVH